MIGIIATVRILADREHEWETVFAERRRQVLASEAWVSEYDLFRLRDAPLTYVIVERFESEAAYQAHLAASTGHERMMACFDGPPVIQILQPIAGCV